MHRDQRSGGAFFVHGMNGFQFGPKMSVLLPSSDGLMIDLGNDRLLGSGGRVTTRRNGRAGGPVLCVGVSLVVG